ncbi:acyl-ACP desaturase [Novispirillum sp. DQ9]|uniref:acyl-ACP desaturase n=1 Tax=Novispirillum sp. DQ9 TaxID=3398612 RepID=UPI003C7B3C01
MTHWTLDDIPWHDFDAARVNPQLLAVVKAAAMVERNAADYTAYLGNVFREDPAFRDHVDAWRVEEERHGDALGRWAEMADPSFTFATAFQRFRDGYRIDIGAQDSIRGSRTGELIARCIVETGTSSFYSALRDASDEPVLRAICHRIAGDEFRHYKLFLETMRVYQRRENVPGWRRLLVALGRIRESEDDELAFAYHAANAPADAPYDRVTASNNYAARAFACYRPHHVQRATSMVLKAAGLKPQGLLGSVLQRLMWKFVSGRARKLGALVRAGA